MAGELYGPDIGLIAAPAAGDRLPAGTGPNAGGYSLRSSFIWKNAGGVFNGDGSIELAGAQFPAISFVRTAVGTWRVGGSGTAGDNSLRISLGGVEALSIDTNGRVGIANASPVALLHPKVADGASYPLGLSGTSKGIRVEASAAGMAIRGVDHTLGVSFQPLILGGSDLIFQTNGNTEYARLTSGGGFGLGVSPLVRFHAKSTAEIARFETTTVRGSGSGFVSIHDPTGRKCYIGYGGASDKFYQINEMNADMTFGTNAVERWGITAAGHFYGVTDNSYSLGTAAGRASVVYAGTGTINTSDERDKNWLRDGLTDAEMRAALRIYEELGFYNWKADVERKADSKDDAREHFGARAQRIWAIMAEEKLVDPIKKGKPGKTPYAFLCYDAWDEQVEPIMKDVERKVRRTRQTERESKVIDPATEKPLIVISDEVYYETVSERVDTGKTRVTVEKGDRYGFRIDQLTLFLLAALALRSKALEERLVAVEAAIAKLG